MVSLINAYYKDEESREFYHHDFAHCAVVLKLSCRFITASRIKMQVENTVCKLMSLYPPVALPLYSKL